MGPVEYGLGVQEVVYAVGGVGAVATAGFSAVVGAVTVAGTETVDNLLHLQNNINDNTSKVTSELQGLRSSVIGETRDLRSSVIGEGQDTIKAIKSTSSDILNAINSLGDTIVKISRTLSRFQFNLPVADGVTVFYQVSNGNNLPLSTASFVFRSDARLVNAYAMYNTGYFIRTDNATTVINFGLASGAMRRSLDGH